VSLFVQAKLDPLARSLALSSTAVGLAQPTPLVAGALLDSGLATSEEHGAAGGGGLRGGEGRAEDGPLADAEGEAEEDDDLSADGPIARRIRAELAAHFPLPASTFRVDATRDGRGQGLFAAAPIGAGSYLFDYEGELLDEREYARRYPDGVPADYAVGLDRADGSAVYVDGARLERSNIGRFLNHDGGTPTCAMYTLADPAPRLLLFALQDMAVGDELTWDYGERYWRARDDMIS
jgi:hypothetical protein